MGSGKAHRVRIKDSDKYQRNYSQVEKEALALVFGVRKFNDFLYGSKFHLITDHKPLVHLFHPGKKLPEGTVKKLQRWALFLSDYNYTLHYRSTGQHGNADALSRLPLDQTWSSTPGEEECFAARSGGATSGCRTFQWMRRGWQRRRRRTRN